MAEGLSSRKISFPEGGDGDCKIKDQPPQKRVRFPKGKKLKHGDYVVDDQHEEGLVRTQDPHLVATERRRRRVQMAADLVEEENRGILPDITKAEVQYEDEEALEDDGVQLEPFNLTKEREGGNFDAAGNYVEYINEKEIKDAWLDEIDRNKDYAAGIFVAPTKEDDPLDLTDNDIGKIKRCIANTVEPGETVLQALRRLKGTSNNKKEKMSAETKQLFDQLTEDAMTLMENGHTDVYDAKQEIFRQEAGASNFSATTDNGDVAFYMFGDDDENVTVNLASGTSNLDPSKSSEPPQSGELPDDYMFDDSSGYYYSSKLGYYYDPSSGLYCIAASGKWFSYNEELGTYDEVQEAASVSS